MISFLKEVYYARCAQNAKTTSFPTVRLTLHVSDVVGELKDEGENGRQYMVHHYASRDVKPDDTKTSTTFGGICNYVHVNNRIRIKTSF